MRMPAQTAGTMRRPAPIASRRRAQPAVFAAPIGGWIANRSLANPSSNGLPPGAAMLENWFPTATGITIRNGSQLYASLAEADESVTALFTYKNGAQEELFAANSGNIYNITTIITPADLLFETDTGDLLVTDTGDNIVVSSTSGLEVLTGQSGGDWVVVQFATSGGVFLRGVNGVDTPFVYDGTTWGTTPAITGVTPEDLNYVWAYKNRLFFVEKNSLNAWYLPVDSIGGAATKFPLGGVFPSGGSLLFGHSWSLGTGASGGLSEQCIFVSTEGEVAVYQGSNPGDANDWSLVGVYRIGKPLGKQALIRAGGDLVIATDIGFIPLSQAIQRDIAALAPAAVSFNIEDEWNKAVKVRAGEEWYCEVWPAEQMVIVALPTTAEQLPQWFVANARTGAWALFSGWDATCVTVFKGRCFFGSVNGKVVEANVTGQDQGALFTATCVPLFEDLGSATSLKIATMARAVLRGTFTVLEKISLQKEFEINLPPAPDAAMLDTGAVWGGATWGTNVWGSGSQEITQQNWRTIGDSGYAVAPAIQLSSGSIIPLGSELVRIDLAYEVSDAVV